jgi:lipopolysaccharide export system protein LptA
MMRAGRQFRSAGIVVALGLSLAWPAAGVVAQSAGKSSRAPQPSQQGSTTHNVPNALQGFSKNRSQPIQIEASSLEVQDKNKVATFRGAVHVKQGDTQLRCNTLVVHYEDGRSNATNGARGTNAKGSASGSNSPIPGTDAQRIRLLEAKGNVVVTQNDQVATGDMGIFDMPKNTITLRGNVTITQGRNVLRGDRLVVDMTNAVSRIESDKGRVQGLFQPSTKEDDTNSKQHRSIMPRVR